MSELDNYYLVDLSFSGDLQAANNGDLLTIAGRENLKQALYHRLITSKGTLVHRPSYGVGLKDFIGKISSIASQRELALRIKDNFQNEPRIKSVKSVKVSQEDAKFIINIKMDAVGYNEIDETFKPTELIL